MPVTLVAQLEASQWYFGENAGLDFSSGAPRVVSDGKLNTVEGVSSISDKNGNLLFYTDGETIYNSRHLIMENGAGLLGSYTSSQSALIVPFINDGTRYYVFTVAEEGKPPGLSYNVVDISANDGYGRVEQKNIRLITPVAEKLTAVKHCNGKDFWVITHGYPSDEYYSFLITENGLNLQPVVSHADFIGTEEDSFAGCMKVSPDGEHIIAAHRKQALELCDFNTFTGVVSNPRNLSFNAAKWYGVEFSADSRLLYATGYSPSDNPNVGRLFQFDISSDLITDIISSQYIVAETSKEFWCALQMGPDHKIYIAAIDTRYLSTIQFPSLQGEACAFKQNAVELTSNCLAGLPAFIQSYFDEGYTFTADCGSKTADFSYTKPDNVVNFEWQFGDPASGSNNYSTDNNPQHIYSRYGKYPVMLIRTYNCARKDTVILDVSVGNAILELGNDTTLCEKSTLLINAGSPDFSYVWQDASRKSWYNISDSGQYFVEMKYGTCIQHDTININYKSLPVASLGPDIKLCTNDTWNFRITPEADFQYEWENGSDAPSRTINTPGIYSLSAYNSCGIFTDSIKIQKGNCTAYLPNAFTPNGDGRNDIFMIGGADNTKEFDMQIYNRWGQLVFTTKDYLKGWDGTLQGRPASEGNYVCVVKYRHTLTGNIISLKSAFVLLR